MPKNLHEIKSDIDGVVAQLGRYPTIAKSLNDIATVLESTMGKDAAVNRELAEQVHALRSELFRAVVGRRVSISFASPEREIEIQPVASEDQALLEALDRVARTINEP
jgi:hypothetical protein